MNSETTKDPFKKEFYLEVEKLTDRELQERMYFSLTQTEKTNQRIRENMQFWFYFFLISCFLYGWILYENYVK